MKVNKLLVFVFAAVMSLGMFGCTKKQTDEIIIGGQNPETGQMAIYGKNAVMGAQLAFDEINAAGGVNGKKIKFVHYDSRGDKTEAVNLTKRLLNSNVCAIIGEVTSGGFMSMRDTANRGKTVAISTGATAKGATETIVDGKSVNIPFAFRNTLQDSDGAPALVEYAMNNKGLKNFAIITSVNNDYSVGLSNFFRDGIKKYGGNIVAELSIADGDTDVSAQITSLRGKNADAVIYTGYYQEASLLLLELAKQGLKIPLIGGDGLQSPDLANVAKDAAIGTIFFSAFAPNIPTEKVQKFRKSIEARKIEADTFSSHGYDAANLLALAIKNSGVTDCSKPENREKIREALSVVKDFDGVAGVMSFDEMGSAVKPPYLFEVVKTPNGYEASVLNP